MNAIDVDYADMKDKLCKALMENQELREKLRDSNKVSFHMEFFNLGAWNIYSVAICKLEINLKLVF